MEQHKKSINKALRMIGGEYDWNSENENITAGESNRWMFT